MKDLTEQLIACVELGKAVTSTLDREQILKIILIGSVSSFRL